MTRHVHRAEVLSIGSELTVGETRDTNAGELAGDLSAEGVTVGRITAVPDDLEIVVDAWRGALDRADLVVSTGGLGPTPDDLTREAIAEVVGESPTVDPKLEKWLRGLWKRRRLPFPEINLKQAWLIPSASAIANDNGTAPGWWVETAGDRLIVAMPGPPREMRPMWRDTVLPRLRAIGIGIDRAVTILRTAGIGESQLADMLGAELLAGPNPSVATYARTDAVDIRISAVGDGDANAPDILAAAEARVRQIVGGFVWGQGEETWADAIAEALTDRGWSLALSELGSGGSLAGLLAEVDALRLAEIPARRIGTRRPRDGRTRSPGGSDRCRSRRRGHAGRSRHCRRYRGRHPDGRPSREAHRIPAWLVRSTSLGSRGGRRPPRSPEGGWRLMRNAHQGEWHRRLS